MASVVWVVVGVLLGEGLLLLVVWLWRWLLLVVALEWGLLLV